MAWLGTKEFDENSYYNFDDLNRVNENIEYLANTLIGYGCAIVLSKPITKNYSRANFPTVTAINDVRQNILNIIDGFYEVSAPEPVVDTSRKQIFDYLKANVLELNLEAINDLIESLARSFKYAGTFVSGQTIIFPRSVN